MPVEPKSSILRRQVSASDSKRAKRIKNAQQTEAARLERKNSRAAKRAEAKLACDSIETAQVREATPMSVTPATPVELGTAKVVSMLSYVPGVSFLYNNVLRPAAPSQGGAQKSVAAALTPAAATPASRAASIVDAPGVVETSSAIAVPTRAQALRAKVSGWFGKVGSWFKAVPRKVAANAQRLRIFAKALVQQAQAAWAKRRNAAAAATPADPQA